MFNIQNFLTRFKNFSPKDKDLKTAVTAAILNILKIKIKEADISTKNNIVYVKTNNIIKNEIFINKERILDEIRSTLKNKKIHNII